jgi:predicted RND superfamily exporter protein
VSKSFREINYAFGESDSIQIILKARTDDLRDVQTARDVNRITAQLRGIPNVDSVSSPYDGISYDSAELHETFIENKDAFNHDYQLTRIIVVSRNMNQNEAGDSEVLKSVRDVLEREPIHNADVSLYGDVVRFDELGDSLQRDAGVTTAIGLALVFFTASAIYASVVIGALALFPVIVAVIWALGLMGFFGVPFTSLSTGIISLVLGVGVDFSIHLVDGIRKREEKGIENAIHETLGTTGSAIVLSTLTTFLGFVALTFATLLGTQRLGWSLALSIISVFAVSMTLVPAIMSIQYRYHARKRAPRVKPRVSNQRSQTRIRRSTHA